MSLVGCDKRGQVTIYVIVGLVIVVAIILFLSFEEDIRNIIFNYSPYENPAHFMRGCTEDPLQEAIDIISKQGGYLDPKNYQLYDSNKVAYLCYTSSNNNKKCVNQEPFYLKHLQDEIKEHIEPRIEYCFNELKKDYEKKGYEVTLEGDLNLDLEISDGQITLDTDRSFKFSNDETSEKYDKFNLIIKSQLYNFALVAGKIVSEEAMHCNFNDLDYRDINFRYKINSINAHGGSKIYEIIDSKTNQRFNIAIRGCVRTP